MQSMICNKPMCLLILLASAVLVPEQLQAQNLVRFDFEDQRGVQSQALESLTMEREGLGVRITRPGTVFTVAFRQDFPQEWGSFALSPFLTTHATAYPFVIDFSESVAGVSIDTGDYGPSDTDVIKMYAYDRPGGKGRLIATAEGLVNNGNTFGVSYVRLSVTAEKKRIKSIVVVGGSTAAPNSVFYDNLAVDRTKRNGGGQSGQSRNLR